ncbi:hypothetical protein LTR78_001837 [Recurvomyces mirabilis]|uniref:Uncharacterized protein n=1 Tax=Recurvomyces mirabilis TaxID=574656 RepID=A0AAE0WVE3_9PEZI|nr:hypothetical protein LTR78_001837 [Recurvomyces mirabilis]KAK5156723.1 hypothetical protein LTS14_004935 [Recurvomyces mirabilis]
MTTTDSFCEKHFLGIVIFITSFSLFFFSSIADDRNILVRQIAPVVSLVDLYLIFFSRQAVTKVTSTVTSPSPPPPPPKQDDPAPFWQLSPLTKTVLSKPSGEFQKNRKKVEASQRQRLVEEGEGVPAKQTTFRTPPNLRRAAVLRATYAEAGWHKSTAPIQATPPPVQTTSTATAATTPAPAPTTFPAVTTPVVPPKAAHISFESNKAPEKITSGVFGKTKAFPYGTRLYAVHTNMHEQMDAQYPRYLETAESFSGFGDSLPGKCNYCDYEIPLQTERKYISNIMARIHFWKDTTTAELQAGKIKATSLQIGQDLATYQPLNCMAEEITAFCFFIVLWCTKVDPTNTPKRIPDLLKLQIRDLEAFGLDGPKLTALTHLFFQICQDYTNYAVKEYTDALQTLQKTKAFFGGWPDTARRSVSGMKPVIASLLVQSEFCQIQNFGDVRTTVLLAAAAAVESGMGKDYGTSQQNGVAHPVLPVPGSAYACDISSSSSHVWPRTQYDAASATPAPGRTLKSSIQSSKPYAASQAEYAATPAVPASSVTLRDNGPSSNRFALPLTHHDAAPAVPTQGSVLTSTNYGQASIASDTSVATNQYQENGRSKKSRTGDPAASTGTSNSGNTLPSQHFRTQSSAGPLAAAVPSRTPQPATTPANTAKTASGSSLPGNSEGLTSGYSQGRLNILAPPSGTRSPQQPNTIEYSEKKLNDCDGLGQTYDELRYILKTNINDLGKKRFSGVNLQDDAELKRLIVSFRNWWAVFAKWLNYDHPDAPSSMARLPKDIHSRGLVFPDELRSNYDDVWQKVNAAAPYNERCKQLLLAWAPIHQLWNS